ncbi:hypothetical protein QQ045_022735 [Rhodiola kirilowii]
MKNIKTSATYIIFPTLRSFWFFPRRTALQRNFFISKYTVCEEIEQGRRCPVCGEARYAERGSKSRVPKKTVKYFPLTPRLQRLYMSPYISAQMRWHAQRSVEDPEYIRHPADGEAWKAFDEEFPQFASEMRNVSDLD